MRWTTEPTTERGVIDRGFALDAGDHAVPGVLLTPDPAGGAPEGPAPLVLIGHGGTLHKRADAPYAVARRLVRRDRVAAALIDLPAHGDRPPSEADLPHDARRALAAADWSTTLDALTGLPEIDPARIGYWGLSLGSDYGLPFLAADHRACVAILGLYGGRTIEGAATTAIPLARAVEGVVLYLVQWDDERFERAGQIELFDAIGAADKRMLAYPGAHEATPDEGLRFAREFLVRELTR
jgi:dienelactone hydrolase